MSNIRCFSFKKPKTSFLRLLLISFLCFACREEKQEKSSSLDIFKEQDSGLVSNLEKSNIDPSLEQQKAAEPQQNINQEIIEGHLADTENSSPKEEVISSTIVSPSVSADYKFILKIDFQPLEIYSPAEDQLIAVGLREVITCNLKDNTKEVLLDAEIFKKLFKQEMSPITASKFLAPNHIILGLQNGEVLEFKDGNLRKLEGGPAYVGERVNYVDEYEGKIVVASKGIFIWDSELNNFMSDAGSKQYDLNSILKVGENELLFSSPTNVISLRFPEKELNIIFTALKSEVPIRASLLRETEVLLGSRSGILRISRSGNLLGRFAYGYEILKMVSSVEDYIMVLTDRGPGIIYKDEIYTDETLNNDQVTSISGSKNGMLVGFRSGEVYWRGVESFLSLKKERPRISQVFENSCHAYENLITAPYSQMISSIDYEGVRYVYFDGEQVCPNGPGYLNKMGNALILKNKKLNLIKDGQVEIIDLYNEVLDAKIVKLFLSSKGEIYIGTQTGLFSYSNRVWNKVNEISLEGRNGVTDMLEDAKGNLWVSTRIGKGENLKSEMDYSPLHVKIGSDWAHFSESNGISPLGINDLHYHNGELILGSSVGYSVIDNQAGLTSVGRGAGLRQFIVESVVKDRDNRIWLSSGYFLNGMSFIDDGKLYSITKNQGLFTDRVSKIATDAEDRIWVLEASGRVGVYDYQTLISMSQHVEKFDLIRAVRGRFLP